MTDGKGLRLKLLKENLGGANRVAKRLLWSLKRRGRRNALQFGDSLLPNWNEAGM